jgi:hypothetical protein
MSTGTIPVTVDTGKATFTADLRVRVQLGLEGDSKELGFPIGAGAVLGVYANVVEMKAIIQYTPQCAREGLLGFNLNVGAYAKASVVIGPTQIGPTPTASTTLVSATPITTCLFGGEISSSSSVPAYPTPSGGWNGTVPRGMPVPHGMPVERRHHNAMIEERMFHAPAITALPAPRSVYTLHVCHADAVNCPAPYDETIYATRTAAPVGAVASEPTHHIITGGVTLTPLPTPVESTLVLDL